MIKVNKAINERGNPQSKSTCSDLFVKDDIILKFNIFYSTNFVMPFDDVATKIRGRYTF